MLSYFTKTYFSRLFLTSLKYNNKQNNKYNNNKINKIIIKYNNWNVTKSGLIRKLKLEFLKKNKLFNMGKSYLKSLYSEVNILNMLEEDWKRNNRCTWQHKDGNSIVEEN